MAGAGYKLFATGDVLTAAQVNTYLMEQTVMRFADSAARTAALSGVLAEGMVSYLQDTNALEVYDGAAWVGATGDITGLTAGTGISISSETGPVPTVTNAMATEITAKGDLIVGTGSATFDNLAAGSNGDTLVADSSTSTGLSYQGNYAAGKNKFINGNMAMAQRGAAAITVAAGVRTYGPDRSFGTLTGAGVFTVEQVVDAPAAANAGQYSMKAVVTTDDTSIAASDQYLLAQFVEGYNFAQFGFGTASAQTVTISFWVKSSITGTFGIAIRNSAANRAYASTYTILAANTWEKKTVTIAGDTSGTWLKDTGIGARVEWTLSAGTDFQTATPNAWTATNDNTTASQTNWMATISNTFQLTAIQIETGSVATAFQTATGTIQGELAACQRYYYEATLYQTGFPAGTTDNNRRQWIQFPVTMRVAPNPYSITVDTGTPTVDQATTAGFRALSAVGNTTTVAFFGTVKASAEL
jgi:hypothetical protein